MSSLQRQNQIFQAEQSVEHAHQAINDALSHPEKQTVENAKNSIKKAEHALSQAADFDNQDAVQLVREQFEQYKQSFKEVSDRSYE